jgi:hypothetical protein
LCSRTFFQIFKLNDAHALTRGEIEKKEERKKQKTNFSKVSLKHFYNYFFAWVSIRGDFRGLNENSYAVVAEMERGALRSGERFAARNQSYYPSVQELLSHHQRLLAEEPAITTRAVRIAGLSVGSLLQTTVRFRFDSSIIQPTLRRIFFDLFREHTLEAESGFEVVVTFNAVLSHSAGPSFSLFYGHDHRASNIAGAAPELKFGSTTVVRVLEDVVNIPTEFDQAALIRSHQRAFESSSVSVHSFVNIVYLIYRYVDSRTTASRRHSNLDQGSGMGTART